MRGKAGVEGPWVRTWPPDASQCRPSTDGQPSSTVENTVAPLTGAGEATGERGAAFYPAIPPTHPWGSPGVDLMGPNQTRTELGLLLSTLGQHRGPVTPLHLENSCTPCQPHFMPPSQLLRDQVPPQVSRHQEGSGGQDCLMLGGLGHPKSAPSLVSSKSAWVHHKLHGTCVIYTPGSCQHRCLGTEGCNREGAQRRGRWQPLGQQDLSHPLRPSSYQKGSA